MSYKDLAREVWFRRTPERKQLVELRTRKLDQKFFAMYDPRWWKEQCAKLAYSGEVSKKWG